MRIKAQYLKINDVTITGEIVTSVSFNYLGTPYERKQVYLTLRKGDKVRQTYWNKNTTVTIERKE